ncbi:hypothetical protein [Rhodanobacter sp. B04]|uniref:hypothetical protein n=1 Tax=Rhodanobacter sp. B04 TaxID=1945860 RepID=UPI0011158EAA|nr:hypothetical protein [Rhodanobacter sp. B04]
MASFLTNEVNKTVSIVAVSNPPAPEICARLCVGPDTSIFLSWAEVQQLAAACRSLVSLEEARARSIAA